VQSEETVLMKCFKYFDLNNNGTVEPEEFAKAIEKIGIMIPTRQVSSLDARLFAATFKLYYRTWIPFLVYTTLMALDQLTTKSSLSHCTAEMSPKDLHKKAARLHLMSLLTVCAKSLPLEELAVSLA